MYELVKRLYPIPRSITGEGYRESLDIINAELGGEIVYHEVPSGAKRFDWTVPDEWNCREAYIVTPEGEKICDFAQNNLHLLNYSEPVNREMDFAELDEHLYSHDSLADAIPYVTSYYARRWGFCLSAREREALRERERERVIRAARANTASI